MFRSSRRLIVLLAVVATVYSQRNGDLRLARGSFATSASSGRLEIYINGQWGTVCDDFFTIVDANVACRQLGYISGASNTITARDNSTFGSGTGTIWLYDVGCTGSESCLLSCPNRGIGVEDCTHSEDVAVFCSGIRFSSTDCTSVADPSRGDLRLATGSLPTSAAVGRLEIYINGAWGTVCNDLFTIIDADIACHQMGYTCAINTFDASSNALIGSGSGQIWLDDVGCTGSESCLLSCSNRGIGSHNCFHSEDVAITCSGCPFITTDCSFATPATVPTSVTVTVPTGSTNIVGIIVGGTIGAIVFFMVIPIIICVVCFCCVAGGVGAAASSSRRSHTFTTTTSKPAATTATVVTTSSQQTAYPQSYPAAGTDVKQAPPLRSPQKCLPNLPNLKLHTLPHTLLNPRIPIYPPQAGYPPMQGGYPPQAGYPPQ